MTLTTTTNKIPFSQKLKEFGITQDLQGTVMLRADFW